MANTEQKVEMTGQYLATTPSGERVTVVERSAFVRYAAADGGWSDWLVTEQQFTCMGKPLNLLADGDWETVAPPVHRLTRQR